MYGNGDRRISLERPIDCVSFFRLIYYCNISKGLNNKHNWGVERRDQWLGSLGLDLLGGARRSHFHFTINEL